MQMLRRFGLPHEPNWLSAQPLDEKERGLAGQTLVETYGATIERAQLERLLAWQALLQLLAGQRRYQKLRLISLLTK